MGLSITQNYARIGIDRNPSRLEMESQNARLELRQKHAKVNIKTDLPRVEIDQYEAFASAGLKNFLDLTKDAAQRGQQQAIEYIGKLAGDGDSLAAIERGGDPIIQIALRDAYPEHEFNIDFIPKVGPKITVKGSVQLDPERNAEGVNHGVEGNFTPANVNINYTPAQVNVFLKQYASIQMSYTENKINKYI